MDKKVYYHFLKTEHAINNLEKDRIKVSLIDELNDPFELLPYLRYANPKKREEYHRIRRTLSKEYGLICFSEKWSEPLLWGHYADKHHGIALGFEILREDIIKVEYQTELLRRQIELSKNSTENKQLFLDLAKVKYEKWSYENEYRILVNLGDCKPHNNMKFLEFNKKLKVKEIILGCKFTNKEPEKLIRLANSFEANIIPTRQSWQDYQINPCGHKTEELSKIRKKMYAETSPQINH